MRTCKIAGCGKKHYAKGLCGKHYAQIKRHGKTLKRTTRDPNEIIIKGDVAEIILYNQKGREVDRTIIDAENVEKIRGYKWRLAGGYVVTSIKKRTVGIQHIIMGTRALIDHKDRKPLNNRKSNYRYCTHGENMMNRSNQRNNTSGYRGVFWNKRDKVWVATITAKRKRFYLGAFKDKGEAAKIYNKAATEIHGEFGYLCATLPAL